MKITIGPLFLLLSILTFAYAHPIKMTVCILTSGKDKNSIKVELNFFADDFQAHLSQVYQSEIELSTLEEETKEQIITYIKRHFYINVEGQILPLIYSNYSLKDNVFHIEFKCDNFLSIIKEKELLITNTLLFKAFEDQTNIMRIDLKGDGNFDSLDFDHSSPSIKYSFNQ